MVTRILFLMSDTGGGHRAAAEAIRDALFDKYGKENIDALLLDVFRASNFPMNKMPEFYPWVISHSKSSWSLAYKLLDTNNRVGMMSRTYYLLNGKRLEAVAKAHPVDVVVCVHSIIARPSLRAFENVFKERPPFVTVVTDLVSTHAFWYDKNADFTLVPTQAAYDRGLHYGMPAEKMQITGLPVNPSFMKGLVGQAKAREALGWEQGKPTILMVAGGDGMGPLYETAQAINAKKLDCQLAIVAGRNQALRSQLEAVSWNQPVHVYGFVTNMPQLMDAADMIVTKAGPATITEAAIAGLPMILMDAIPGQEEGNVEHVVQNQAGVFTRDPQQVAETVAQWLAEGQDGLKRRSENAQGIARPEAVWEIADKVMEWAQHGPVKSPQRNFLGGTRRLVALRRKN